MSFFFNSHLKLVKETIFLNMVNGVLMCLSLFKAYTIFKEYLVILRIFCVKK